MRLAVLLVATLACQRPTVRPLVAAGSNADDGHGMLARASARMVTSDEPEAPMFPQRRPPAGSADFDDEYGGAAYGGDAYGGAFDLGGASYGAYIVPPWPYPTVSRMPGWAQRTELRAAIEGTITWRGPTPALVTACGTITPIRAGADRRLAGVVVYLERVAVGRTPMHATGEMRPATVGGVVVKRGCSFSPSAQVVAPVPAQVAIHGDRNAARVVISMPQSAPRRGELQEAGRIAVPMKSGLLRVEGEDGTLGAAFVLGVESPAFSITDEAGRFRLDELAPGNYELVAWFPPIPTLANGKLVYGDPIIARRSVRVDASTVRVDLALAPRR